MRLTVLCVAVLGLALFGCGDKKTDESSSGASKTEKSGTNAAASAGEKTGKEGENKAPAATPKKTNTPAPTATGFKGTWQIDTAAMAESDPKFKEMPPAIRDTLKMAVTIDDKNISMKISMMGKEQSETQAYTLKKSEGNVHTLEVTTKEGTKEEGILTVKGNTLTMEKDGDKLILKR